MPKVDLSAYAGREQAYVKHCLLEEYLPDWAYKVGSKWDSLVYVDGFAGPWKTKHPDYADSSFGVAIDALRRSCLGLREGRGRKLRVDSILVEQDRTAFACLERFARSKTTPAFGVHALCGEFADQIPAINQLIKRSAHSPFRFVFLDPKGWSDIPMEEVRPLLRDRSCEVLINLMTRHIIRFLDEPDRADSYRALFGRPEVLEVLQNTPRENNARAEQAVREYCRSLRLLCDFKYVSSAVILEPDEESIRYFLVYATNHPRGVEVFKDAEIKAARIQDDVRHETHIRKTGQPELLLGGGPPKSRLTLQLRDRYAARARKKVIEILSAKSPASSVPYSELFCEAMAFPLVTPDDLETWLRTLEPSIEIRLAGSARRRKPSPSEEDGVLVRKPDSLR
ncbi:MAG TPA: three-Cys-motif partner protein TcmP [Candidatus Acidoferrum sp.]|nr:three-Cys-motif partner protein TcmP [Candidatus Acidoferrum sp.]